MLNRPLVIVRVETTNWPLGEEGHHWHLYVNGKEQGMSQGNSPALQARDLLPGENTIEVVLSNELHQELNATDKITVRFDAGSAAAAAPSLSTGVVFVLLGIAVSRRRYSGHWLCGDAQESVMRIRNPGTARQGSVRKSRAYVSHFISTMPRSLRTSLVLALLLAVSISGVVFAHADIARSDPAANAVLDRAPAQITIEFTEPSNRACPRSRCCTTMVRSPTTTIRTRDPNDSKVLHVSLKDSREGTYIVSWRALSEADGHVTSGSFVFSVGQPIDPAKARRAGSQARSPRRSI